MQTHQFTLQNGVTVLATPQAESRSTTLFVTLPHGSRHESKEQAGLAHFYEHMVFKGGKKFPTAAAVSQALDRWGAFYNAYTDSEQTAYFAKIATDHFDAALDVISDYLVYPNFKEGDIERERGVIIEEHNKYWDMPADRAEMQVGPLLFGDTPLGRPVIGDKEVIKRLTRADFRTWQKRFYGASSVVISVAGAVPERLPERLTAAFKDLPAPTEVEMAPPAVVGDGPRVKVDERPGEQTNLVWGVPALAARDRRLPVLAVLRTVLGGSMSSRLFTEIREKRGLCYSISFSTQAYSDSGAAGVTAGLDSRRLTEAVGAIRGELDKLATKVAPAAELTRAKEFLKGATTLTWEDSAAVAQSVAGQWMFEGRVRSLEERFGEIDAVTAEQVRDLAAELFRPAKTALVLVGPAPDRAAIDAALK